MVEKYDAIVTRKPIGKVNILDWPCLLLKNMVENDSLLFIWEFHTGIGNWRHGERTETDIMWISTETLFMPKYFGMDVIYREPKSNSDAAELPRYRYAGLCLSSDED